MSTSTNLNQFYSKKLIGLDLYFNEMVKLYEAKKFPKVLLLTGKKGIGKFTLVMHFIIIFIQKMKLLLITLKTKLLMLTQLFIIYF